MRLKRKTPLDPDLTRGYLTRLSMGMQSTSRCTCPRDRRAAGPREDSGEITQRAIRRRHMRVQCSCGSMEAVSELFGPFETKGGGSRAGLVGGFRWLTRSSRDAPRLVRRSSFRLESAEPRASSRARMGVRLARLQTRPSSDARRLRRRHSRRVRVHQEWPTRRSARQPSCR